MEFPHTGDETTGYYQNSHTPDIENNAKSHYQKLNVQVISVEDNQYDQLSHGTFKDTKPYDGYLQLPEFNREHTESNYDYLKLYGSVKANQCPDIGAIELSDFPSGHDVDIENRPRDKIKQDTVALDSIHLNEDDIYHEINDTARPNLNKTHQGSKNNLDVSQKLHTNKYTTNTDASHKHVSKGTSLTWKHKCMVFVIVVVITVLIAVGAVIYILVNKESEKAAQTHISCTHVANARLYFGPIEMLCTIPTSEKFEYVGFHYGTGLDNSLYGTVLNRNGTIFQIHKSNSDIYVRLIELTSQYMLIITFSNVTCAMDGVYRLALMRQEVGTPEEYKGTNGYLQVKRPTGKPTFTLNADQVIDIVFPNGHYYRDSSIHKCEGRIGQSQSNLEIDITFDNGISFQQIPDENIDLFRTNISDECSKNQTVSFGLRFSAGMDGARLRCRVSDSFDDFTLSEKLSLISRNICNCGASESYRGHPGNCNVQVYCVEENGTMYPRGIACTSKQCRNSITGYCTNDCSDPVCNEAVPSDFCTTIEPSSTAPTVPTYFSTSSTPQTTSSLAFYIVCTDIVALGNSETAVIRCSLNDTATFTVLNITYKRFGKKDVQQIALIDESNNIHMFAMEDIVNISMLNNIINIKILNPSCEYEGTFAVVTDINGESVMDQGKFSVISKPNGDADLQLHPDQIAGLMNYRTWLLHSCIINVGYPPGEISIEMMKQDESKFTKLNVIIHSTNDDTDNVTCSITRTVAFGFLFTADMDKATIRCSVTNDFDTEDSFVFSNNDTVSLIPIDFCKNQTDSRRYLPHPTNCHSAVQCELDVTYGVPCPSGQCFGVTETIGCNYCYLTTCQADVSTTPVPGSSTSAFAIAETTTPESSLSFNKRWLLITKGHTNLIFPIE